MIIEGLAAGVICYLGYKLGVISGLIASEKDPNKKKELEKQFWETQRMLQEKTKEYPLKKSK